MSKVFVTQQVMSKDESTKAWQPKFDLSPAMEYGDLTYLFGSGQVAIMGDATPDAIEDRLDEEQYDPQQDYLLATGDMVLGMQAAVAMMARGGCRVLRWDGKYRRYTVYNVIEGVKANGD